MDSTISLISIIISTISTAIALIMLFWTRQDMNRRSKAEQEMFIDNVYEQFQEQTLAMIQDKDLLKILARDNGKTTDQTRKDSLASIRINQAYRLYRLAKKDFLDNEKWRRMETDVVFLFQLPSIKSRWEVVRKYYPFQFRQFVTTRLQNSDHYKN